MNSVSICLVLLVSSCFAAETTGSGDGYEYDPYDWVEWYMREFCVKYVPEQCSIDYRMYYEDYYISRLESPCYCDDVTAMRATLEEDCSSLENAPIIITNPKDGKMLAFGQDGLTVVEGEAEASIQWTYQPSCYGGVTLNNGDNSINIYYDPNLKTIMNEDGLFALNSIKGFKWVSEIKFLKAEPGTPWKRYQWDVSRVLTSFEATMMRASTLFF